jgi:Mg-chelatase subunit ChlI
MTRFTLLFLLFLPCLTSASELYKWVDENGRTQYSQFPPEDDKQAQTLNIKHRATSNQASKDKLADMRQKLLESSVDRNTESEEEKEEAERAKIMAENCKGAKQNLRNVKNHGRIYKTLENGERHWYDEKGRAALIKKAQGNVTKYCSK